MTTDRCNGTRGWFPSNYVKIIASNKEQEPDEELIDGPITRNNEYRLSISYHNAPDKQQTDKWISQQHEQQQQQQQQQQTTDLGSNPYLLYNESLIHHSSKISESTVNLDSEYESDQISTIDMPSWSDQSTLLSMDEKVVYIQENQFILFNLRIINPSKKNTASMVKSCNISSK